MARYRNPFAFTPLPVTIFITLSFIALFAALISVHNVLPPLPKSLTPAAGVNLTTAWLDLQYLTNGFHPFNSRRNDVVHNWLLQRIEEILKANNAIGKPGNNSAAQVFNDNKSALTFSSKASPLSVSFTGTNIIVYIRGSEDPEGRWWENVEALDRSEYGVLVNAHFDSVPSGFGATDDGIGVVSVLQIIAHFTAAGHQPKRGIIALLNNGEEDYLNGAVAFSQHPTSKFPHTFLNLEGAGAGGRAVLFRSTDTEVTKFYQQSPYPSGMVVSADGFKHRLIRSETDYSVFAPLLGMRGLDVAFMEPRSRYHTVEDAARYTSMKSLWHMLSSALATLEGLTSETSSTFEGDSTTEGGVPSGKGSDSVWFDLFGRKFAIFKLHTLFAISVTLLVVTPVVLIAVQTAVSRTDRWYLFARYRHPEGAHEEEEPVYFKGWRGFFRFPIVFVISSAAVVGIAFLIAKVNPYISYSSEYAVWSTMLTAWFIISWFLLRGADATRPTALQRMYSLQWIYALFYVILVANTVAENNFGLGGGYFLVIYFGGIFMALLISYFELFALPKKTDYVQMIFGYETDQTSSRPLTASHDDREERPVLSRENDEEEANEQTSLLRGDRQTTFGRAYGGRGRSTDETATVDDETPDIDMPMPYPKEQRWSGSMPSWTWILQFLLIAPIPVILVGEIALLATAALHQTAADGSSVLTFYLITAVLSVLLLLPLGPFIHRFHILVPLLLLLICSVTLIYNLVAFPFSEGSRLKVFFIQRVDLDSGINEVSLTGLQPYVRDIITSLPSSAGQSVDCSTPDYTARSGLTKCAWQGTPPNVLYRAGAPNGVPPEKTYRSWLSYNVTRAKNVTGASNEAIFTIRGQNTRACRLLFDRPIQDYNVTGYSTDPRFPRVGLKGCREIRLWTREWGGAWHVRVRWSGSSSSSGGGERKDRNVMGPARKKGNPAVGSGLDGRVVCLWSDANDPATIPAFTEALNYMPTWSVVTKLSDGLVEGFKRFSV